MPAIRNPKATCATCPYWFQFPRPETGLNHEAQGYCRRESPRVVVTGEHGQLQTFTEQPWTPASEWCGEHPEFLLTENNP